MIRRPSIPRIHVLPFPSQCCSRRSFSSFNAGLLSQNASYSSLPRLSGKPRVLASFAGEHPSFVFGKGRYSSPAFRQLTVPGKIRLYHHPFWVSGASGHSSLLPSGIVVAPSKAFQHSCSSWWQRLQRSSRFSITLLVLSWSMWWTHQ